MSTAAKAGETAVILGASGAVGKHLLSELLSSSSPYKTVYSFARRAHPSPPPTSIQFREVLVDFDKVYNGDSTETAKLSSIDAASAVYITMGTTRAAAGGMEAFERIDRGYVLAAAKALAGKAESVVYCSSGGSSSSSLFPYLKSKGLTEEGLAQLYGKTVIMRPGYLANAERPGTRILEKTFEPIMGLMSKFSTSVQADVRDVAKAMLKAGMEGPTALKERGLASDAGAKYGDGQAVVLGNAAIVKIAKE
ncbi:NAD(P)-binding domain protein [Kalmanozyma brasiliensis GHG001]|uniref:NAD(P)-binding domain-containing protein n=1 Tax=Kalmanozyma brasiliensis (strain GHG001) TaxID=1365824 RepID=V5ETJ3_KALBG|nr:NAD(P)-binding domain protein [Kalmanozyma brasiliensis GHG001]EST06383.1 NAD(P)-binding domain protein [Kalmanozyma brasiliensis GHG001]